MKLTEEILELNQSVIDIYKLIEKTNSDILGGNDIEDYIYGDYTFEHFELDENGEVVQFPLYVYISTDYKYEDKDLKKVKKIIKKLKGFKEVKSIGIEEFESRQCNLLVIRKE